MSKWYLMRHGETLWNMQQRTQGQSEVPLTERGIKQAMATAQALQGLNISCIFCSDLSRAMETARIISERLGVGIKVMPELREMNMGRWEGLTIRDISALYKRDYELWRSEPVKACIEGGESLTLLTQRMDRCIDIILSLKIESNILIISHALALKVLILRLLNMDLTRFNSIKLDNASLTIIDIRESGNVLTLFNDICHLKGI